MSRSDDLFTEAKSVIPGGVNSPVRAFNGVGGTPVYFKRAQGAYVYDEDGSFADSINVDVDIHRILPENMEAHRNHLREIISDFVKETGSQRGQDILDNYADAVGKFWLVKPKAAKLESLMEDLQRRAA